MNVDPHIKSEIINTAANLSGQIKGWSNMLRNNRNSAEILTLFLAIRAVYLQLSEKFDSAIRMDLNIKLHTHVPPPVQTDGYRQLIEDAKLLLQKSDLKQLDKIIRQLRKEKIIP